jgi:anti-anti-sigma factor
LIEKAGPVVAQGYKNLVLDLQQVNYVSSGGLVAFQNIAGKATGAGGKLVIAALSKNVAKVFELSGFDKIIPVYPDLAAARASFGQK